MASGKSDKLKGRVKEAAGALTGDRKLKRQGLADQAVGNIKQMVEDAIEMVESFFDWVKGLFASGEARKTGTAVHRSGGRPLGMIPIVATLRGSAR